MKQRDSPKAYHYSYFSILHNFAKEMSLKLKHIKVLETSYFTPKKIPHFHIIPFARAGCWYFMVLYGLECRWSFLTTTMLIAEFSPPIFT